MTSLVDASDVTWAAVNNVVWHGAVPGYRLAESLSRVSGFAIVDIIAGSERAAEIRKAEAA